MYTERPALKSLLVIVISAVALSGCRAGDGLIQRTAAVPQGHRASSSNQSEQAPESARPEAGGPVQAFIASKGNERLRAVGVAAHLAESALSVHSAPPTFNTEQYDFVAEGGFLKASDKPLSTFSVDVDTASYSNVRRYLQAGKLPPTGAVRIEELINYFSYDYPRHVQEGPFSVVSEVAVAPWAPEHRLLLVGLHGKEIELGDVPPRNLVFLIDVSGSMQPSNKLELVQYGLKKLTAGLRRQDRVAIVVYAGASGLVLEPTSGRHKDKILTAIDGLRSGGSTNGGQGIRLAYSTARKHFDPEAINRVVLATDGDFNVGTTSRSDLIELIEKERESGVFLTLLGVGQGNLHDATMEQLADKGNGNYAYLDSKAEARKVLIEEAGGTLITIAKDVKIQIEFNPAKVQAYRLIGYENRRLADEDFNDDKKDAGEIGAGHSVTALYEIIPIGVEIEGRKIDDLRYQKPRDLSGAAAGNELVTVRLRYKQPDGKKSDLMSFTVLDAHKPIRKASGNLRFASAIAAFGMTLRESEFRGGASFELAGELARDAVGADPHGYRSEFIRLAAVARDLKQDLKKAKP